MIEVRGLTKKFGSKLALDDVSFTVRPGAVTGFLGPNGAGKSTLMRILLGQMRADAGSALINGRPFASFRDPLKQVGALLDANSVHKGRSAYSHVRAVAATHGIRKARVLEVLEQTGLDSVDHKRAGTFSMGMNQRLGIATALLGDPQVLVLDEPVNGLDPDGVMWVRELCRSFAAEGRTVFLSSHLMSELELVVDHLIVLGQGKLLANMRLAQFISQAGAPGVRVRCADAALLAQALAPLGGTCGVAVDGAVTVRGMTAFEIGEAAAARGLALHELVALETSLESAYVQLTQQSVEYRARVAA